MSSLCPASSLGSRNHPTPRLRGFFARPQNVGTESRELSEQRGQRAFPCAMAPGTVPVASLLGKAADPSRHRAQLGFN